MSASNVVPTPAARALLKELDEVSGSDRASKRIPDLGNPQTQKRTAKRLHKFAALLAQAALLIERREMRPLGLRHYVSHFLMEPYTMGELLASIAFHMNNINIVINSGRLTGRQQRRLDAAYLTYTDLAELYPAH